MAVAVWPFGGISGYSGGARSIFASSLGNQGGLVVAAPAIRQHNGELEQLCRQFGGACGLPRRRFGGRRMLSVRQTLGGVP